MENKKAENYENFNTSAGMYHYSLYQADIP